MTKWILVSGLIPYDSGKTWFTLGAGLYARNTGLRVTVYKPVAAHNAWYSPRTLVKSRKLGVLVGNDVSLYYDYGLMQNPGIGNPIALLAIPLDPVKYSGRVDKYFEDMESILSITAMSRITNCKENTIEHYYYPETLKSTTTTLSKVIEKLAKSLNAKESRIEELEKYLSSNNVERNIDACLEVVSARSDLVLIESFNDAITPILGLLDRVSTLAIVAPTRLLVYSNVNAIARIIEENTEKLGWEGLRARYILERLKPDIVIETRLASKPGIVHSEHIEFINYISRER